MDFIFYLGFVCRNLKSFQIMHIAYYTTRRPIATSMFFLAVVLLGVVSFSRLPVNLLPDITFPRLLIWTNYRDVGPVEIEEFVTIPIEETVSTVPGVQRVHSTSRAGISLVTVEFTWGTDMDFTALTLREKLDNLSPILPREVERPVILRVDPRARPIMTLAISGGKNNHHIYTLARDVFKRRLEQIDGIAMATVTGGQKREIQVDVNMARLTALGLSLSQIERALQLANDTRPGGSIKKGRYRYALRTVGEFQSVEEIGATVINTGSGSNNGVTIRLDEIATIRNSFRERQGVTRYNNQEAIGLLVTKESGANTVQVAQKVVRVIDQLKEQYPEVNLVLVDNQAEFISGAINQVKQSLIFGGILAFIVLFFFLHDARNPINIAISMPISIIATFTLMYFAGVSVNMVSLGGLALGVGMLVDNSIVVLENIFRHQEEGLPLQEASVAGVSEVSMAITASTFTTIAVFFPIIYIRGVAGQLFRDQSLTVVFSLLSSLVVALTLLPMVAARWQRKNLNKPQIKESGVQVDSGNRWEKLILFIASLRGKGFQFIKGLFGFWIKHLTQFFRHFTLPAFQAFDRLFARFLEFYEFWLKKALNRTKLVLTVTTICFLLILLLGWQIDRRLMPEVEQHRFTISVQLPPGTILQATEELTTKIENLLYKSPEVKAVFSQVGFIEEDIRQIVTRTGMNTAELQVFLYHDISTKIFMQEIQQSLASLGAESITLRQSQTAIGEILGTNLSDLAVQIRGDDPDAAAVIMATVRQNLTKIKGISQVFSSQEEKRPEIRLIIDREKAAAYDIEPREISGFVQLYMHGSVATDFKEFDRKIPILLRAGLSHRQELDDLLQTPILLRGRSVPLSQVIRIEEVFAPASIEREDQVRKHTLFVGISERGYNAVASDVEEMIADVKLPSGFQIHIGGQRQEMIESFRQMTFAFLLAFVLVFLILAAQFESLLNPFIIILTIPLAIIGVVIGLLVTGQSFNVMSLIGLVVLVGIVVNDAIIKVDFINQARRKGTQLREAILLAGKKRLRPILMTTITTVLALLPMAIGFGDGAELRRPLAIAIIFGLSFATVLTLIVVPVLYQVLDKGDRVQQHG